ncbi:uncharacterized protein ccp110 isoform X2 [Brachyhypopomus gauderio]|uniref:uncharacterized protein ccp110 isoform X2 n=1 Tax=Brachyhypopomus gauderio TaxID=698409 RepID=UPI004040EF55
MMPWQSWFYLGNMETYEEFYLRTLTKLQSERMCETNTPRLWTSPSFIYFHGRTVLSPLLSQKDREEMDQYRHRALRSEAQRLTCSQNNLINQVQKILENRVNAVTVQDPVGLTNKREETLTGYRSVSPLAEHPDANSRNHGEKMERDEEIGNEGVSLQNLLQRSQQYNDKEEGRRESSVHSRSPVLAAVSPECKENDRVSPVDVNNSDPSCSVQFHNSISPVQAKTPPFKKPEPVMEAVLGFISSSSCSPHSVLDTDSVLSPRPHRGRPLSAGSVLLSYPLSPGKAGVASRRRSQGCGHLPSFDRRPMIGEGVSASRRASHSGSSPVSESDGTISTPDAGYGLIEAGFRRRCHTLDSNVGPSHQSPPIDRSQERIPRFMAGVLQRAPNRRSPPAQLSPPFVLESPTSPHPRSSLNLDLPTSSFSNKRQLVNEGNSIIGTMVDAKKTEEVQWQVQTLEELQRTLKEEHALQISLLMAEQEREQQHLSQELEEKERRLRDQDSVCAVAGDVGGLQSPVALAVLASAIPPVAYLWGPNRGMNKPRNRLSQVLNAEQQKALCRLCATARGFLTRRLLNTEKVKHLRQTVKDTQEFISSFHTEAPQKRSNYSTQDVSLQERVRAQLRAALFDIHDIFFAMPLDERLALLAQDRELRAERKLREMEKAKVSKEKMILSAATQKVLDRKKQRAGESPVQARRGQQRPKSPLTSRSLHKKPPEERLRRSDSLKKQHSLGERTPS